MIYRWLEIDGTPHTGVKDPKCKGSDGLWCMIDSVTGNTWLCNEKDLTEVEQ